jgi:hypothetical protein
MAGRRRVQPRHCGRYDFTLCPLGAVALLGGLQGSEAGMRRAQFALFAAGALLMLAVIVELLRRIVFGGGS